MVRTRTILSATCSLGPWGIADAFPINRSGLGVPCEIILAGVNVSLEGLESCALEGLIRVWVLPRVVG